jgi:hypothetical protein
MTAKREDKYEDLTKQLDLFFKRLKNTVFELFKQKSSMNKPNYSRNKSTRPVSGGSSGKQCFSCGKEYPDVHGKSPARGRK